MTISYERIALNPLQWVASPDGWIDPTLAPPLAERLKVIQDSGIKSLHTDVPAGMSPGQYGRLLADHDLTPAPGYIAALLPDGETARHELFDRASRISEQHAELGVPVVFLAMGMSRDAPRVAHPASGHAADPARLEQARDLLAALGEVTRSNGVAAAFHPHVGTWAETEEETRFILDSVPADVLSFGPDIGHLGWAGADNVALVRDYGDRVASMHIKDFRADIAAQGKQADWDYRATVRAGLWAEPGQASVDIAAVLDALPASFGGWLIVEVDRGSLASPEESVVVCGQWARKFQ
jgi:inosose dehydratase